MKNKADILIKNITVHTQDSKRSVLENVDVAIRAGKIFNIGTLPADDWAADTVLDGGGKYLFPGMQNPHVHIFQSVLKGLGADLDLITWCRKAPQTYGPPMNAKMYSIACKIATMESLKCGVTTIADFNYLQQDEDLPHASIETMEHSGIRGIYMDCFHDTGLEMGVDPKIIHPAKYCVQHTDALAKRYHTDDHPRMRIWAGASVPWGSTEALYKEIAAFSAHTDIPYTMHLLESQEDNKFSMEHFGKPIVEALEEFGFLSEKLLAVHCIKLSQGDIEIFARHKSNAAYCPMANAYLGSGIPPMVDMRKAGVNICTATDGAASNNSSDMLETLKMGLLLQKAGYQNPTALSAQDMLDIATINGAKSTRRETELGSVEVGKLADLFIFNPAFLRSSPNISTLATLMYNSSQENIETTIVDGKIAYHKGNFTCGWEEASVVAEAERETKAFLTSIG